MAASLCCSGRLFCPSCHQKRALLFAEHVDQEVLGELPIRQYVVTIPKMLRLCFNYDRKLLGELSRCFYDSVKKIFLAAAAQGESFAPELAALPALISSVQTYGDDPMRFHPHLHCLAADGLLGPEGSFFPLPRPDPVQIMFRHRLLKGLLAKEKITQRLVEILLSWKHPGFSVFQADSVSCEDREARERLARYMVHPPVGLYRLRYDPQARRVTYGPKNHDGSPGADSAGAITCPALDFLAALCTHIPDAGQQLIRYYGQSSHVRRARARRTGSPAARPAPSSDSQDDCARRRRRSCARLIKKVYEAEPLLCARCGGPLKIISFIDAPSVIERILLTSSSGTGRSVRLPLPRHGLYTMIATSLPGRMTSARSSRQDRAPGALDSECGTIPPAPPGPEVCFGEELNGGGGASLEPAVGSAAAVQFLWSSFGH